MPLRTRIALYASAFFLGSGFGLFLFYFFGEKFEELGALSGWVAAAGALLAALLTLRPLRGQLLQMQRQTSFLLVDERPTFDVYQIWSAGYGDLSSGSSIIYARIVNWNRRSLFISEVGIDLNDDFHQIVPIHIKIRNQNIERKFDDDRLWELLSSQTPMIFQPPLFLYGWEDRTMSPNAFQVKFWFHTDPTAELARTVRVYIAGFQIGGRRDSFRREFSVELRRENVPPRQG